VKVAGSRWKIEDGFAAGKELTALDEHQVRSWTSWHRWTILALLACAFLAVLAAAQPDAGRARDDQLIPLTCHEIRRLFTGLGQQPPAPAAQLHWSRWRRRHQCTARACHYRRRASAPTLRKCRWRIKRHRAAGGGSSKRQQPHRPRLTVMSLIQFVDLPKWPALTRLPLVRIEGVGGCKSP